MSGDAAALEVEGLCSGYGKSEVLDDVTFTLRGGEITALLGRNGAGKTTALRTIAGVHRARAGSVRLHGSDVTGAGAHRRVRAGLSLVPQGARAFGTLTVEDNLKLVHGTGAAGGWSVERVYETFPALHRLRASAGASLSGGERQLLAVGRALRANPTVIMLDEPSEGLSPVAVRAALDLLRSLRDSGIAVLLAEQNHHAALRVADRCMFLEKGHMAHQGAASDVSESDLVARYLGV